MNIGSRPAGNCARPWGTGSRRGSELANESPWGRLYVGFPSRCIQAGHTGRQVPLFHCSTDAASRTLQYVSFR